MRTEWPRVTLEVARSLDGREVNLTARQVLQSPAWRVYQRRIRGYFNAVMVSDISILEEAQLDADLDADGEYTRKPIREYGLPGCSDLELASPMAEGRSEKLLLVVVAPDASRLALDPQRSLFERLCHQGDYLPWVFTSEENSAESISLLRQCGAYVSVRGQSAVDMAAVLQDVWNAGVRLLLAHGDADLNTSLLATGAVEEIVLCLVPLIMARHGAAPRTDDPSADDPSASGLVRMTLTALGEIDGDTPILYYTVAPSGPAGTPSKGERHTPTAPPERLDS